MENWTLTFYKVQVTKLFFLCSASSDETDESVLEAILEKQQQTYNGLV